MPLTIDFREAIRERAQNDAVFRRGLLQKAIELMPSGDVKPGKKSFATTSTRQSVFTNWRSGPTPRKRV